jgi:hypothetical protein
VTKYLEKKKDVKGGKTYFVQDFSPSWQEGAAEQSSFHHDSQEAERQPEFVGFLFPFISSGTPAPHVGASHIRVLGPPSSVNLLWKCPRRHTKSCVY